MAKNILTPLENSTDEIKVLSLEDFKKRVRTADCIDEIFAISTILEERGDDLRKNQIDALRLRFDIHKSMLNKLIPDLKAVDHSSGELASKVNFVINLESPSQIKEAKSL